MPKLALHWQNSASWMKKVDMPAPYVKRVNPNEEDIFPGKFTVGRVYMTDGEEGSYYTRGAEGGRAYFDRCASTYWKALYVGAWESWNEPAVIHDAAERAALDEATGEWIRRMHDAGLKTVAGNFSERNPADGTIDEFVLTLEATDYLGGHFYDAPGMQSHGYALRYRELADTIRTAGLRLPPMLIGECGIDGGVIGKGGKGWQKFCSWEQYFADLRWYEAELAKDAYISGAFIFTAAASKDWKSFEVNEKQAAELAQWQRTFTPPEPEPEPEPPAAWLPEYEQGTPKELADAARWWSEEITRQIEAGAYDMAHSLEVSQTKLLYRLEGML